MGRRGGDGEMYGESNMETYMTVCKIDGRWEFAVWLRKLKQGLCVNLEEWDGELRDVTLIFRPSEQESSLFSGVALMI